MQDSLGNTVTTGSTDALRMIDAAIDLHARAWPGALDTAEAATREDPELAIGHALQGFDSCDVGLDGEGYVKIAEHLLDYQYLDQNVDRRTRLVETDGRVHLCRWLIGVKTEVVQRAPTDRVCVSIC